jgi:hypothetical protein
VSTAAIDFSTVAVLLFVLWLDGWRRVEPGSLIVSRVGLGTWTLRTPSARVGAFALVAWWPPVVFPLVVNESPAALVSPGSPAWTADHAISVSRGRRRVGRVAADIAMLRILGTLLVVWIALGIPLMTAFAGGAGLVRGIAGAFVFAGGIAVVCSVVLLTSGVPRRNALRKCFPLVSPFSAARAAELVVGEALGELPPAAQLAALLDRQAFAAWLRPWAYDEVHARQADGPVAARIREMIAALPQSVLSGAIATIPSDGYGDTSSSYCPRCGHWYFQHVAECSECADVSLLPGRARRA